MVLKLTTQSSSPTSVVPYSSIHICFVSAQDYSFYSLSTSSLSQTQSQTQAKDLFTNAKSSNCLRYSDSLAFFEVCGNPLQVRRAILDYTHRQAQHLHIKILNMAHQTPSEQDDLLALATQAVAVASTFTPSTTQTPSTTTTKTPAPSTKQQQQQSPLASSVTRPAHPVQPQQPKSKYAAGWGIDGIVDFQGKPSRSPARRKDSAVETGGDAEGREVEASASSTEKKQGKERENVAGGSYAWFLCPHDCQQCTGTDQGERRDIDNVDTQPQTSHTSTNNSSNNSNSSSSSSLSTLSSTSTNTTVSTSLAPSPQPYADHLMPLLIQNPYITAEQSHRQLRQSNFTDFHRQIALHIVGMLKGRGRGRGEWEVVVSVEEDDVEEEGEGEGGSEGEGEGREKKGMGGGWTQRGIEGGCVIGGGGWRGLRNRDGGGGGLPSHKEGKRRLRGKGMLGLGGYLE